MDYKEIYFNLNLLNFLIISGIIHNFIIAGILFCRQGDRKLANRIISLIICIVNLHLTYLMVLDTNTDNLFPSLLWIPYSILTAIGPLILFYTKALTDLDFDILKINKIHFIPPIVELGFQVIMIILSIRNQELFYNTQLYFYVTPFVYFWVAVSIFYYLRLSLNIINNHETWVLKNFSNLKHITLIWLRKLIVYYRLLWIVWVPFVIVFLCFFKFQLQYLIVVMVLYFLMLILVYLTFWIGIESFRRGSFIYIYRPEKKTENKNFRQLTEHQVQGYIERINQLMDLEKIYLNENLSLKELASHLKADPNLISFILNNHFSTNFYEFVNRYRVDEIKKKLNSPRYKHLTLLGIAMESGFNSKTTFNRVFKQATGITPTEFRKRNHK